MKKNIVFLLSVLPFLVFISCSNNERNITFANLEDINFSVFKIWQPNGALNGLGAEIWIKEKMNKNEIVDFIQTVSSGYDPVVIKLYTSMEAYRAEINETYGNDYNKGYILFYVKNYTGKGAYRGFNEIRWMQEKGEFSHLFGTKTKF